MLGLRARFEASLTPMSDSNSLDQNPDESASALVPATPSQPPALRASEAEREQVVNVLREAAGDGRLDVDELDERLRLAYAAQTRAELGLLIADVTVSPVAVASSHRITVREGPSCTRMLVSIMGGNDRSGCWRLARTCTVVNVMAGSELDLNQVELSGPLTTLNVLSVMGGSEIRVPDGVEIRVSKLALMGGNDVRLGDHAVPPGGRVIHIRLLSIMGGTSVSRGPTQSRAGKRRERELRKVQRREEHRHHRARRGELEE